MRHVTYNMKLTTPHGKVFFFSGFKSIPENQFALHALSDASTLYVTIFEDHDEGGRVVGSGVMYITPADFARQVTTMRVLNASSDYERLTALARFGRFFAGTLWNSYCGIFAGGNYFNPTAPPHSKRILDIGAPLEHFVPTEDNVTVCVLLATGRAKKDQ